MVGLQNQRNPIQMYFNCKFIYAHKHFEAMKIDS